VLKAEPTLVTDSIQLSAFTMQVRLPHVDWSRVLDADLAHAPRFTVAAGYDRITLPDGLQVGCLLLHTWHVHVFVCACGGMWCGCRQVAALLHTRHVHVAVACPVAALRAGCSVCSTVRACRRPTGLTMPQPLLLQM
jgi:hypothetical protein